MRADLQQLAVRSRVFAGYLAAACLLAAAIAAAAEPESPAQQAARPILSVDALAAVAEPLPSRRSGAAPQLPEPQRAAPPASELSLPAVLSRPVYRTAESNLTLGVNFEIRKAQTFLLGTPFPFTAGSDANGRTNITALRFYQNWLDRDADHAFAARSTLSFGIDALGATVVDPALTGNPATGPAITGKFFNWLGQVQYVRRIYRDWEAVVRSDLQISNRALFLFCFHARCSVLVNCRGLRCTPSILFAEMNASNHD